MQSLVLFLASSIFGSQEGISDRKFVGKRLIVAMITVFTVAAIVRRIGESPFQCSTNCVDSYRNPNSIALKNWGGVVIVIFFYHRPVTVSCTPVAIVTVAPGCTLMRWQAALPEMTNGLGVPAFTTTSVNPSGTTPQFRLAGLCRSLLTAPVRRRPNFRVSSTAPGNKLITGLFNEGSTFTTNVSFITDPAASVTCR